MGIGLHVGLPPTTFSVFFVCRCLQSRVEAKCQMSYFPKHTKSRMSKFFFLVLQFRCARYMLVVSFNVTCELICKSGRTCFCSISLVLSETCVESEKPKGTGETMGRQNAHVLGRKGRGWGD